MNYWVALAAITCIYATTWFAASIAYKRNDIADVAWGVGFPVLAWASLFISNRLSLPGITMAILISIWGARLAWHIHKRQIGKPEDFRYAQWRKSWKHFYIRSFLQVFLLQAFLMFIICLPVLLVNNSLNSYKIVFVIFGSAVWIAGFICEAVADSQLRQFMSNKNNKGRIMQSGLWAFSRHPNYFGEATMWWGIFIISLSTVTILPALIGPLAITYFLLYVSGVPLLEERYKNNPDYAKYSKVTNTFIPGPRKHTS